MAFSDFLIAAGVGLFSTAVFFAINGLLLKLISGWMRFSDKSWSTAYKVVGIASVISWVLSLLPTAYSAAYGPLPRLTALFVNILFAFVNAAVLVWLIYRFYYTRIGKSILAWLIIFISNLIIGFMVGILIAAIAVAFAFNAAQFV